MTESASEESVALARDTADPNKMPMAQILREVAALKEFTTVRMDGIEKAVAVAHADLVRIPTETMKAVTALRDLVEAKFVNYSSRLEIHLEKFEGIKKQFEQIDKRLDKSAADATVALATALQSAKELVTVQNENNAASILKSDTATDKKLEQQGSSINTMRDGFNASLNEVKGRLDRWESQAVGRAEQQTTTRETSKDRRDDTSLWVAIGGLVLGVVIGALGFIIAK